MQISVLTSKQKYDNCRDETYQSIERLQMYFCVWCLLSCICLAVVVTNLVIYKGLGNETILILMLISVVTGQPENTSNVSPSILIVPMCLLAIFAFLPFMIGRMLNVGCTVNYSRRIAKVLLVNVCLMLITSLLSIVLDLVYLLNVD